MSDSERQNPTKAGECRLKVEVLYIANCPSHLPTVKLLKDVLAAEGIKAEITEVLVADEQMMTRFKFRGSPTIRINGLDIAEDSSNVGAFACRFYPGSQQNGVPPIELVRRALLSAREGEIS